MLTFIIGALYFSYLYQESTLSAAISYFSIETSVGEITIMAIYHGIVVAMISSTVVGFLYVLSEIENTFFLKK